MTGKILGNPDLDCNGLRMQVISKGKALLYFSVSEISSKGIETYGVKHIFNKNN